MMYDFLILGGGVAGTTAAETIRAKLPEASIAILGDEPHRLYSRVLLPHMVRGAVDEQKVFLRSPDFYEQKKISYLTGVTVTHVESGAHTVTCASGEKVSYGKLLIATGGVPRRLSCPGGDDADILFFQTLDDARLLMCRPTDHSHRDVAVVGGGFIALELLMSFVHHGFATTAFLRGAHFFSRTLDEESGKRVNEVVRSHGVVVETAREVTNIEAKNGQKVVSLTSGDVVVCATLGVGIGLRLRTDFLDESGVAVRHGVVVDEYLRTSAKDVYAAGDVAEYFDPRVGRHRVTGTWGNALLQGKVAGINMSGGSDTFSAIASYGIQCFGLPIVFLGVTDEKVPERIVRVAENSVTQFFIERDRLVGVSCVGAFTDRAVITAHIMQGAVLDAKTKIALAKPVFPVIL